MKAVVAEKDSKIFMFHVALYSEEHSGEAKYPQRTQLECHQMQHQLLDSKSKQSL